MADRLILSFFVRRGTQMVGNRGPMHEFVVVGAPSLEPAHVDGRRNVSKGREDGKNAYGQQVR